MTEWLMSANSQKYNHQLAFQERGYVYWRQIRKFVVGDLIYFYCTKPIGQIQYLAVVDQIAIPYEKIENDKEYYENPSQMSQGMYIKLRLLKKYEGTEMTMSDLAKFHFIPPQGPQRFKNLQLLDYVKLRFGEKDNERQ